MTIKNILTSISGVANYGVISILIFFAFFIGVLIWAFSRRKDYLSAMGALPLDGGEPDNQSPENHSTLK